MRFARITVNSVPMNGLPCIRGLRMPITMIVGKVMQAEN